MDPWEFGSIAAILLVLFLWGPQKIPDLARMVAQARKEFDNASREFQKVSKEIQNGTSPLLGISTPAPATPARPAVPAASSAAAPAPAIAPKPALSAQAKTGDQLLIEAARRLGISTGGKTREQIQEEIIAMAQRPAQGAETQQKTGEPAA